MYGKFINDDLIEAPQNFKTPNGELITNFTNSIEVMKLYGFKEITGNKPDYDSNTEILKIVSHEEKEDSIECVYEKISISSLLKTATTVENIVNSCKGELLDARKSTKNVNGTEVIKEYASVKERLDNMESFIYDRIDITDTDVTITIEDRKMYVCSNLINSLILTVPPIVDVNFSTKIYFQCNNEITLDNIVFMGDHCENGKLKTKYNNEYIIDLIYANQLLGIVSCSNVINGDEGNSSDAGDEDVELHSFSGGADLVKIAKTYWDNRTTYLTYGMRNILTNEGALRWTDVTRSGADSPDSRYRALDCSAFVNLCMRGIEFDDVLKSKTVYESKDLTPRTSKYGWATQLGRTAGDMCKDIETLGWSLPMDKWHTDDAKTNWLGLEVGDIIFFKDDIDNSRYKNIGHVSIYYGVNSKGENCVIEFSGGDGVKKHSDKKTCGCQIIAFSKKNRANIVSIARCQK